MEALALRRGRIVGTPRAFAEHMFKRYPGRLPPDVYRRTSAVFSVSFATRKRLRLFEHESYARTAVDVIFGHAQKRAVNLYAWCVMPDHVHLLFSPSDQCDAILFVGQAKNLAQREIWSLGHHGLIWQQSFYDRLLRESDDFDVVVSYILDNPRRAGLVQRAKDYPFAGTQIAGGLATLPN